MNQVYKLKLIIVGLFALLFSSQLEAQDYKKWEISYSAGSEFIFDRYSPSFNETYGISYKIIPLLKVGASFLHLNNVSVRKNESTSKTCTIKSEIRYLYAVNEWSLSLYLTPVPTNNRFQFELGAGYSHFINYSAEAGQIHTVDTTLYWSYRAQKNLPGIIFTTKFSYRITHHIKVGINAIYSYSFAKDYMITNDEILSTNLSIGYVF